MNYLNRSNGACSRTEHFGGTHTTACDKIVPKINGACNKIQDQLLWWWLCCISAWCFNIRFFFSFPKQIFERNGTFKFEFGRPGKTEGMLWFPVRIAIIRSDNRLIVADTGVERFRLQIFSESGIFINKICCLWVWCKHRFCCWDFNEYFGVVSSGVSIASALNVTHDGHIVIVDKFGPHVYILNECGEQIRFFDCSEFIIEPSDAVIYGKSPRALSSAVKIRIFILIFRFRSVHLWLQRTPCSRLFYGWCLQALHRQ